MGRSIKKGPFVQAALLKHVEAMNASGKKQVIKTWSRASTILTCISINLVHPLEPLIMPFLHTAQSVRKM